MPLDEVRIQLDAFEGPLDLLLHLIRRDEVEIADIPIARITEQYLASLTAGGIDRIDIEVAGEFLVMAATLMEIKSRMLIPPAPEEGRGAPGQDAGSSAEPLPAGLAGVGEDPRADLVRQLMAYKKYRDAAHTLDRRLSAWENRFPGGGAGVPTGPAAPVDEDAPAELDLEDVAIVDLTKAFAAIMETVDFTRLGEHRVADDETPISLHATDIVDRLRGLRDEARAAAARAGGPEGGQHAEAPGEIEFRQLFVGRTRAEAIGLFLALLELIRQRQIEARQDAIHDRIVLRLLEGDVRTPDLAQSPQPPSSA